MFQTPGTSRSKKLLDQRYNKWDLNNTTRKGSIKHLLGLLDNKATDHERVAQREFI